MRQQIREFLLAEEGQDFVEFTLLLAMIALTSAGLFFSSGASVSGIWNATDVRLANANSSASS